jgi:hypothetical protein
LFLVCGEGNAFPFSTLVFGLAEEVEQLAFSKQNIQAIDNRHAKHDDFSARIVKKLELAVSRGFTSQPQHSSPTCLSPFRSTILHPERRNAIRTTIRERAMNYCCRW